MIIFQIIKPKITDDIKSIVHAFLSHDLATHTDIKSRINKIMFKL